jgi:signal transduction histidine kinase
VYTSIYFITFLLLNLIILAGFTVYNGKNVEDNIQKDFQIVSYNLEGSNKISGTYIKKLSEIENVDISIFDQQHKIVYSTLQDKSKVKLYKENMNSGVSGLNGKYLILAHNEISVEGKENTLIPSIILNDTAKLNGKEIYIEIQHNLLKEFISILMVLIGLIFIDLIFTIIIIRVGSKASGKIIKPVENMTSIAKNININVLDTRLDISGAQDELKELAETFNDMLDRIQKSYKQQNQFVSDASHELRTPISVIQGYANLLSRWGKNDKDVLDESIEAIKTEAESMKDLIEKLLFLARGDNNRQTIEKHRIVLNELIDEIIRETRLIDNIHQIINIENQDITINADGKLLKEALRIFIDNSIKYTPSGGEISINSRFEKKEAVVTIKDNGIGIPKDDLPNIFNRFYRADKSRTKETGGNGLGLSIAKWIILIHNGSINVESRVNYGTTITIVLPLDVHYKNNK